MEKGCLAVWLRQPFLNVLIDFINIYGKSIENKNWYFCVKISIMVSVS